MATPHARRPSLVPHHGRQRFFKKYNEFYGHLAGDDCIRQAADAIGRSVGRVSDVAARYGGEEFAVILPNTDSSGALNIAREIKERMEAKAVPHAASTIREIVTLSFGLATVIPHQAYEAETLVALADKALYRSKRDGRDRITVALHEPGASDTEADCGMKGSGVR